MGNYMSDEPPQTPWPILHQEVIQLGEEFEVEFENGDGGKRAFERCRKYPGHKDMSRISQFCVEDIPAPWREPEMFTLIMEISRRVVKINVRHVSPNRPDKYCLSRYRGKSVSSCGSGYANIFADDVSSPIDCPIENCKRPGPHKVTHTFEVCTANHVVYDHIEAEKANLTFFHDAPGTETVKGEVLDVIHSYTKEDYIRLRCVSHDLKLFDKIKKVPSIPPSPSRPLPHQHPRDPLLVIVSHPHGFYKHVSFGEWVGYKDTMLRDMFTDNAPPSGSYDEVWKSINSMKMSHVLRQIELKCPTYRETGKYSDGMYTSPEVYRQLELAIQDNPNITVGDFGRVLDLSLSMQFITYTAATCPGSSGARVVVYFDKEDETTEHGIGFCHYRHFTNRQIANKHINASGLASIRKDHSAFIKHHKQSLTEEKYIHV